MLNEWFSHCYVASCQFDRTGDALIITNDTAEARGSWIAWWSEAVALGQQYQLLGMQDGGQFKALFYRTQSDYMHSVDIEPGSIFEIPDEATMLRIDGRLWNEKGKAIFQNIQVVAYQESEPEPEPPEVNPTLPLPEPDTLPKSHVTGYKWGRNIFVMVHGDAPPIPPDWGDAYEVKGFQHGRRLDLEIGNIITAAEPAKEE